MKKGREEEDVEDEEEEEEGGGSSKATVYNFPGGPGYQNLIKQVEKKSIINLFFLIIRHSF